jgi:hypothetical protein
MNTMDKDAMRPVEVESEKTTPVVADSTPTRRVALGRMAMAAAAAMVEANRAAAQGCPPGAGPGAHSRRWKHFNQPPEPRPKPLSVELNEDQLKKAWQALGANDAVVSRRASNEIYSATKAVSFLKARLKEIDGCPDPKKVAQLITALDSDDFDVRQKAAESLHQLGIAILPQLEAALSANLSVEVRNRLEKLVAELKESPVQLQAQRALELLGELPSKEAKDFLADLSNQAPETWLAQIAKKHLPGK